MTKLINSTLQYFSMWVMFQYNSQCIILTAWIVTLYYIFILMSELCSLTIVFSVLIARLRTVKSSKSGHE